MKKVFKFCFLILAISLSVAACKKKTKEIISPPSSVSPLGLQVNANGVLMRNGKPYRGVGVNYFSAFYRTLSRTDTSYRAGFSYLKSLHIPFIRFMACGFWPNDWNLYQTNKTQYFAKLDEFVHAAEQDGIGLIPSLFWNPNAIPDLVGESVNQWGNPNSKTIAFMRTYTSEVVMRYKNSPAIWGWEFSNEMNSNCMDLLDQSINWLPKTSPQNGTPASRTLADATTTSDLRVALTAFAKAVRLYDPSRIIISGNNIPGWNQYHRYVYKTWVQDSISNYASLLGLQNPDAVNTISIHLYPQGEFKYFADFSASLQDIIRISMDAAIQQKKPLFIGEFGAQETDKTKFTNMLNGIEASKVPLSAVWVFDYPPQAGTWNITPTNGRQYQVEAIGQLNVRIGN